MHGSFACSKWDESKYRIVVSGTYSIPIYTYGDGVDYVRVDGLQIKGTASNWARSCVRTENFGYDSDIKIKNCSINSSIVLAIFPNDSEPVSMRRILMGFDAILKPEVNS